MKIGAGELILILVVSLIALGPEKMPLYAQKLGKALKNLKKYTQEISEAIDKDIIKPLEEAKEPLSNISNDINKPIEEIKKSIKDLDKPKPIDNIKTEENSTEADTTVSISVELNEEAS